MNQQLRHPDLAATTRAAEGLARRRWTTAELLAMVEAGILDPDERFELIGGEVVPMSPKGRQHEILRSELPYYLMQSCSNDLRVEVEPQFNLTADVYTFPDLLIRPASIPIPDVRGTTALLVVEIADTSLVYDLTTKAPLYAAHGVRDYWVINARTLVTKVFRAPSASGYAWTSEIPDSDLLTLLLVPGLRLRLADLGVPPL